MHVNNTYAIEETPSRPQYDDSIDYYVVRCPYCRYTSHRMTLWAARDTAQLHEQHATHGLFEARVYRADSMAVIQSDRDSRRIFY